MDEQGSHVWILVAEDDPDDRLLLEVELENCSLACKLAFMSNGAELILFLEELLSSGPPFRTLPDLILINSFVPLFDLDRLKALIREKGLLDKIPIVVLISSSAELEFVKREKSYAGAFLMKPVRCKEIVKLLKSKA